MKNELPCESAQKYCCICGTNVDSFLPWVRRKDNQFTKQFQNIGSDTLNFSCPNCGNHDRSRHLHLFMEKLGIYDLLKNANVLCIAPEIPLYQKIKSLTDNMVVGDLCPERYPIPSMVKINLCKLAYESNYFDVIIANHVLEHIVDYLDAMKEIHRVIKTGGFAILQTPFSSIIYNNFEDPFLNTPELRDKFFGQADHVRIFGRRFFDDLISVGFHSYLLPHNDFLKDYDPAIYGVNESESLMLAIKPLQI